jgi:class 3 adenylate cyclase
MGNIPMAMEYYGKSLTIAEEVGDRQLIANTLSNMGTNYTDMGDTARALDYVTRSLKIFEEISDTQGIAWANQNVGSVFLAMHNYPLAMDYFQRSMKIFEDIGDKKGASGTLIYLGKIYKEQNIRVKESEVCLRALQLAREIRSFKDQYEACQCLYGSYKAMGKRDLALEYHEQMLAINDSLQKEETTRQLERMELRQVMLKDSLAAAEKERLVEEAHKEEVRKKNRTRNILAGAGLLFLILAGGFYSRWRYIRKSKAVLQLEKDRSENLLLNILPEEIAWELKVKGKAEARDFDMVTILFTDFKGFTHASGMMSAQDLVSEINTCFEAFDAIVGKYNVEKIKTIGDAYMAAGGLPVPSDNSVKNTVHAALEMQDFIVSRFRAQHEKGRPAFEMRVGIHTGPVVAGIVGVKKFQYDIWGDTVNTASRMESNGFVGKVNISQSTYELIRDDAEFVFESRGKIHAKGKGDMEMYFVSLKI